MLTKRLRHNYTIENHPVSKLPSKIQEKYLKGLGAILFEISEGDSYMRMLFEQWCVSISGKHHKDYFVNNLDAAKEALTLNRIGLKFFRLKNEFVFDAFQLTQAYSKDKLGKLSVLFEKEILNVFTKGALKYVLSLFDNVESPDKIPDELYEFWKTNIKVEAEKTKSLLIVANMSAGKSTLVNALVGYRINKVKTTACTSRLCRIYSKTQDSGLFYYEERSAQNPLKFKKVIESIDSDAFTKCSFVFNSKLKPAGLCIIDTPGVNNVEHKEHKRITEKAIQENAYDAVLYVCNCQYFGINDEKALLQYLKMHCKKPIIFALNQLDRFKIKEDSVIDMLNDFKSDLEKMGFKNPIVVPVSAWAACLMKADKSKLDDDDLFELKLFEKKFSKDYYDLPRYLTNKKSANITERTGIHYLEETINKILL